MNINILKSYSQAGQDLFAIYCNQGAENGFYFEAGSNEPVLGSNTALLERDFNWSGISIEYVQELCDEFNHNRKNPCLNYDLNHKSLTEILDEQKAPKIIDYMSHDLDNHPTRYDSLKTLDFNKYKIKCLTWEHDFYDNGEKTRKDGLDFLRDNGMQIVVQNVMWQGKMFESWAVDPNLVDEKLWKSLVCDTAEYTTIVEKMTSNQIL